MRILLDHCVDGRLAKYLPEHEVKTTRAMGWDTYQNGALLAAAETQFDVFLTVDQNIPHQQNMSGRTLALVIVKARNNRLPTLAQSMPDVARLLTTILPGQVYRVQQEARLEQAGSSEDTPPDKSGGETE